jgi:hypothetical protein
MLLHNGEIVGTAVRSFQLFPIIPSYRNRSTSLKQVLSNEGALGWLKIGGYGVTHVVVHVAKHVVRSNLGFYSCLFAQITK